MQEKTELLTNFQRKKIERDERIRERFAAMLAGNPDASRHRICTALGEEFGLTAAHVTSIISNDGCACGDVAQ